ncbi:hypothetical protein B0H19DRAFT_1058865 [Mycena capillaripes]|nr:hypothetical protein B0H19DRAFT_1058865 [Mycena capillaripes]
MSVQTIAARHSLIPLDKLLGPWIFGITCLQVYMYFTKHCARDPIGLKVFLLIVFLGMLVQMSVYFIYLFYAFRIWTLSHKSPYIPVLIVGIRLLILWFFSMFLTIVKILCSLGALSLSIVYVIRATITKAFDNTSDVIPFSTGSLSLEVACDLLITGGMVYNLLQGRTEFSSQQWGPHIVKNFPNNVFVVSKTTLYYAFFFFILVRLYGLSFMSILSPQLEDQLVLESTLAPSSTTTVGNVSTITVSAGQQEFTFMYELDGLEMPSVVGYCGTMLTERIE